MRLGCCGSIEQAADFKAAGLDYVEVNVQRVLQGEKPDSEWNATAPDISKLALPIEAANGLVPGSMPVVGPGRDIKALQQYMQNVAKRAAGLGITRLVFGSGDARKRPDDIDQATAMKQIVEFTHIAGQACEPHGVMIVIEHLNKKETNTINSLAQAAELMEQANHPNVQVLVDTYHYALENEQDQAILDLGEHIQHVHVAEPIGRVHPGAHGPVGDGSDAYDFEHFFCLLRKVGYDQGISFEGKWDKPVTEVGAATTTLLRQAWEQAGKYV